MVSIAAFQAVDPGSIPGQRNTPDIHATVCFGNILAELAAVGRISLAMPDAKLKLVCCDKNDGRC